MKPSINTHRILQWSFIVLSITAFFLLCSFKILDRDFWWHITAGKLMLETGGMIETDPFAFTRAGLPYLATHEWLAQIILYGVYAIGGTTGVILFRSLMMTLTFFTLLAIDWKRLWPNALIAIAGAAAVAGTFLERPQLFTFLIVALQLFLALRYLETDNTAPRRRRIGLLGTMVALQILWVNLHGAAALVGFLIFGSVILQRLFDLRHALTQPSTMREGLLLGGTGALFLFGLLVSPSGIDTIGYLYSLMTDKTIAFISEWRPRESGYLFYIGPFWILWITSLIAVRKDVIFGVLVGGITGYLSLQAVRHEPLFMFATLAITFYQLRHAPLWQRTLEDFLKRPLMAVGLSVLLLLPVAAFAQNAYRQVVERDNLWGYGVFAPARGAADFIEKENIGGNAFNTYGVGGYLIHRWFPERKVFIDGRNVDYGFDFMNAAFLAGHDTEHWRAIEHQWDLTVAVVDYDAIKQPGWLSYSHVLDTDSSWPLVYIDDWSAVYVKNTPDHARVIDKNRYRILTAEGLEFGWAIEKTPKEQWSILEAELRRAIDASPESVKARNLLATLLLRQGKTEEAELIANDIETLRPHRPEPWALRALAAMLRSDYAAAGEHFETMLSLAGDDYPNINYEAIADVFAKAGNERKQRYYLHKAGKDMPKVSEQVEEVPEIPEAPDTGTGTSAEGLIPDLGSDILRLNNKGIALAEVGEREDAHKAFMDALMLDPGNPLTLSNLSALSIEEKKYAEAIDLATRALVRAPDFDDAHYNLALAYILSGDIDAAEEHVNAAEEAGRDVSALRQAIDRRQ